MRDRTFKKGCSLNAKIDRAQRLLLQFSRTLAKLGNRDPLRDVHYRLTDFLHHAANGTTGLVGTRALLLKRFADTTDRRQRTFDMSHHHSEGDFLRATRQPVSSRNSTPAL